MWQEPHHAAEADANSKLVGLIEIITSHRFTHVGTQFVPTIAFGDDAFGQALGAITTICLPNYFKDEFVHQRVYRVSGIPASFTGSPHVFSASPLK